jgi:hypothetical protein
VQGVKPARIASLLVLLALGLSSAATAQAQAPFDSPGKTDRIEYVNSSTTPDGFTWDLYRNLSYPCSVSGYQTFAVGTRTGSSPTEARPLWVRMRGGGVGYFSPDGQPQPSANNKVEEDIGSLAQVATDSALNQLVNADPAGFRDLSVSMCNHDIYGGGDQPDPNNPNLTPDGQPRTTNGLFATKAAIRWTQDHYPTTRTFLHGTSAGSYGGYGVAWSLQLEDRPVAGFVADSGVPNRQYEQDLNAQATPCARGTEAVSIIGARLHPTLTDPANQPDLLVSRGDLTAPVFNIWDRDDQQSCGADQVSCTMPDGSVTVMGSMECKMDRISKAIAALPADRGSRTLRVCVAAQGSPPGTCNRHVVTGTSNFPNTDPAGPADYNAAIMDWVRERLADTPPALDVGLGKAKRLRAGRRAVTVRCTSGGHERRACAVRLEARIGGSSRVLARGDGGIGKDAGSRRLKLKLTGAGRIALRHAGRRGLRVRALVSVSESYTDRAGRDSGRLRLLGPQR